MGTQIRFLISDEFNVLCPGGKGKVPDTDFPVGMDTFEHCSMKRGLIHL